MVQIHGIRRASADAKYRQMTGQPVKPLILKLCLPAVISNLVTTAYNLTDTFFIGQLGTARLLLRQRRGQLDEPRTRQAEQ